MTVKFGLDRLIAGPAWRRPPIGHTAFLALPLIALASGLSAQSAPQDRYDAGRAIVAGLAKIVTPGGVDETFQVTLGGARQVVNVRGANRENPILIFIHGGPGAVEMPFAWTFQRPWEDFFTVVQWDQRGAGRSYPLNDPSTLAPTLTIDRYRDDTIELIELLRHKYGKRKVVLLGHSWGSLVGLAVAVKRPDLLHAYVGMGQYIDPVADEQASFAWTRSRAREDGNAQAIHELDALQPYPGDFSIDKIDAERKWTVHYGGLFAYRSDGQFYFDAAHVSPEYTARDIKAWDQGSGYSVHIVEPELAKIDFATLRKLDCPVFLFEGRHDRVVPSAIAAAWLDRLTAPQKATIWFENSGHMMMVEEPGHVLAGLIEHVLPLARGSDAR